MLFIFLLLIGASYCGKILLTLTEKSESNGQYSFQQFNLIHTRQQKNESTPRLIIAPHGFTQSRFIYKKNEDKNYCLIDYQTDDVITYVTGPDDVTSSELNVIQILTGNSYGAISIGEFNLNIFKCESSVEFSTDALENYEQCLALYLLSEDVRKSTIYKADFKNPSEEYFSFHGGWINYQFHPTKYAYQNGRSQFHFSHLPNIEPKYSSPASKEKKLIDIAEKEEFVALDGIVWSEELSEDKASQVTGERSNVYFDLIYYSIDRNCSHRPVFIEALFKRRKQNKFFSGYYKSELFLSQCFSQRFRGSFNVERSEYIDHHVKIFINVLSNLNSFPYKAEKIDIVFSDLNSQEPNDEIEACAGTDCIRYIMKTNIYEPSQVSEYKTVIFTIISLMYLKTPWKVCVMAKGHHSCKYHETQLNGEARITVYDDEDLIMIQGYRQVNTLTIHNDNKVFEVEDKVEDNSEISTSCMFVIKDTSTIPATTARTTTVPTTSTTSTTTTTHKTTSTTIIPTSSTTTTIPITSKTTTTSTTTSTTTIPTTSTSTSKIEDPIVVPPLISDNNESSTISTEDIETSESENNKIQEETDNIIPEEDKRDDDKIINGEETTVENSISTTVNKDTTTENSSAEKETTKTPEDEIHKNPDINKTTTTIPSPETTTSTEPTKTITTATLTTSTTTLTTNTIIGSTTLQPDDNNKDPKKPSPSKNESQKDLDEYCKAEVEKRYPYAYIMFPISVVFFLVTVITVILVIKKYKYEVYNFIGIKPPEFVDFHANL